MNKSVYLGLSRLYLRYCNVWILVWFVKPKHGEKEKLSYMATDSLFVLAKTDNIYKDVAEDVEKDLTIMKYIEHFLKEKRKKWLG